MRKQRYHDHGLVLELQFCDDEEFDQVFDKV